jgi:acyl carrier protein
MTVSLEEIRPIFVDVLGEKSCTITEKTRASDVEGWDSFAHITIVVAVEEKYGVAFTTEELGQMTCVGDFITVLNGKL